MTRCEKVSFEVEPSFACLSPSWKLFGMPMEPHVDVHPDWPRDFGACFLHLMSMLQMLMLRCSAVCIESGCMVEWVCTHPWPPNIGRGRLGLSKFVFSLTSISTWTHEMSTHGHVSFSVRCQLEVKTVCLVHETCDVTSLPLLQSPIPMAGLCLPT